MGTLYKAEINLQKLAKYIFGAMNMKL